MVDFLILGYGPKSTHIDPVRSFYVHEHRLETIKLLYDDQIIDPNTMQRSKGDVWGLQRSV